MYVEKYVGPFFGLNLSETSGITFGEKKSPTSDPLNRHSQILSPVVWHYLIFLLYQEAVRPNHCSVLGREGGEITCIGFLVECVLITVDPHSGFVFPQSDYVYCLFFFFQ